MMLWMTLSSFVSNKAIVNHDALKGKHHDAFHHNAYQLEDVFHESLITSKIKFSVISVRGVWVFVCFVLKVYKLS